MNHIPQTQPSRTQLLIKDRRGTHGNFYEQSWLSQELKKIARQGVRWDDLTCMQKEALQMILHKLSRILSGDPNCVDHWLDIQGYSQLIIDRLDNALGVGQN
jgi:hypothetical protein